MKGEYMKKLMIIFMVLFLVSCSNSENSLYEDLSLLESNEEIVDVKNEIIKKLLQENDKFVSDYPMIIDKLDSIRFSNLSGTSNDSQANIFGDLESKVNDTLFKGQFVIDIENEAFNGFSFVNPILVSDTSLNIFNTDILGHYMDLDRSNKEIIIENDSDSFAYNLEDLMNYRSKGVVFDVVNQTYIETVEMYFVNSILSSKFDVLVKYRKNKENYIITEIDKSQSQLVITPLVNLYGRWGIPFRLEPLNTDFAVLVVKDYDGKTMSYKGRMFLYSWQIKADHVNNLDVYDVTLAYNLNEETVTIVAGEKTQSITPNEPLEFLITKISNYGLVCEPLNWTNITRYPLVFSKDYDTISILNNKQVMLKTVAESDDKSTVYHD